MQIRKKGDVFSAKSSLQREILEKLASTEPKTKSEIKKLIHGHYSSTWEAIDSLLRQGLIRQVTLKVWKNREYPQYWLTDKGILVCLGLDLIVSTKQTFQQIRKIYPENAMLFEYVLKVSPYLNREVFRIAYESINRKGKLEFSDLLNIVFAQAFSEPDMSKFQKLIKTAKEYPEFYALFKDSFSKGKELMDKISQIVLS